LNLDYVARANDRWRRLSNPDKLLYRKDPSRIMNIAHREVSQINEECKTKSMDPPSMVKNSTLIKRPMNITKQEPNMVVQKMPNANNFRRDQVQYQMMADNSYQKQNNDQEVVTL
jgi:hypothetical protein